jgi:hypothetical protein
MGTTRGVLGIVMGGAWTGDNDLAGEREEARPSLLRSLTRAGLAGMGTGRCMAPPPPPPPLDEELMMLSILNELTRPPPLLTRGGEAATAKPVEEEAGLPAPPPSLLLPLLSVLNLCFLRLGEPFSKSRSMERFLGETKWPSLTSRGCGTGLVGRRGISGGDL